MNFTPPTPDHLSRLYYELEKIGARSVGEKKAWPYRITGKEELFCLAADWSRWDPRLLEILVQYAHDRWEDLLPQKLRRIMKKMRTPETVAVITSFVQSRSSEAEELMAFWNYVTNGLQPVEPQFYFFDLYTPGSSFAEQTAKESLLEFKEWGFLGKQRIVIDTKTRETAGTWDQAARQNILKRLFIKEGQLQISDYLEEINYSISRQQALLDLKALKAIPKGEGRGSFWLPPKN
ncbi:MAG: hypothetical protein Q7S68_03675 [Deltaproteobacteria bacterium]|nr:hypothetical protein [Deltaproteobacteria bacterium]